jgi:hypothetical protein
LIQKDTLYGVTIQISNKNVRWLRLVGLFYQDGSVLMQIESWFAAVERSGSAAEGGVEVVQMRRACGAAVGPRSGHVIAVTVQERVLQRPRLTDSLPRFPHPAKPWNVVILESPSAAADPRSTYIRQG